MRMCILAAAAVCLSAAPLAAQPAPPPPPPMPMMSEMMETCMQLMTGTSPAFLLGNRQALSLTSDQVSRLETIRTRAEQTASRHMQTALEGHMAANAMLRTESPDFQAYESRLREAANQMVQAHVALARGAVEARQVLTPEQRSRLATLPAPTMGMMGGAQQPGMQNQPMHPGMMMVCMGQPGPQGGMPNR